MQGHVEGRSLCFAAELTDVPQPPQNFSPGLVRVAQEGQTVMFVAIGGKPAGLVGVADPIKASAASALRDLAAAGLRVIMLTGDNAVVAKAVSARLGLTGQFSDMLPADKAGVGAAMKLVAVNGRRWTADLLRTAVKMARTNSAPIELLVENEDYFKSCKLDYHEGEKYPRLERDSTKPDLLTGILKSRAPAP